MSHFKAPASSKPPEADKHPHTQTHHGITLHDDYFWLRSENWQEAMRKPDRLPAAIKQYLLDENAWYEAAMADTDAVQQQLIAEMRGRIEEHDEDVPAPWDQYAYFWRYEENTEHPSLIRTLREGGDERILLDGNQEAAGKDYFELGLSEISPAHSRLAWSFDVTGSEHFTLLIRNTDTGEDPGYTIPDVESAAWCDEDTIFYSRVDANHRPGKIFRHRIGDDPANDVLVMEEQDPRFRLSVSRMLSGKFLLLSAGTNDQDEHYLLDTAHPASEPVLICSRQEGLEYSVEHQDERLVILTNADNAVDFKLVTAPVAAPQRENWSDLVPYQPGRMLLNVETCRNWIVWMERENALPRIKVRDHDGREFSIAFEEEAYSLGLISSREYDTDILRFSYSSPTTPMEIFDYDPASGERTLRKTRKIPSGHDPANYITRRLMAVSHDGAEVPVTLLYRKDTPLDGSAPCFLYGYGSYGHSLPAHFSSTRLSLVDRGFVFALAHVRGGQEKGRAWYEAAKLENKPNTFHDFIAVASHLIENGFSAKGNIVCHGGSAGGLLIGAVVNMAPELFVGAIADVPFVDVLNTILDETLPLTPGEWSQWGNPLASADAFRWIAAYSPYDNIKAQDYPAMLVTAGVSDPRVTYWEPAKWVAKLRQYKTDDNVLLLRTNMTSGHYGNTGRFAGLEDLARCYAFALKACGKLQT